MPRLPLTLALLLALCLPTRAHDATAEMADAASAFLAALTPEQKAKATFPFQSEERSDWHFVPRPRKGLPIKEMTKQQRIQAHLLLATGLSRSGYTKAANIISLEEVLAVLEKDRSGGPARDPDLYFFSVFGQPGTSPWGWRLEGHHLSLNFTAVNDAAPIVTPTFFGSNPGEVKEGPRAGTRVLGPEEELGRALVKALSEEQRKKAVILPQAPKDILNVPGRNDTKPEGITWSELTATQRDMLLAIVREYIGRHRSEIAAAEYARLEKAGLEKIHFAWAGGLERGQPHYYRIQSGNTVLEYDNVQNGANHVHTVWRDFDRDFGADALGEHYKAAHGK